MTATVAPWDEYVDKVMSGDIIACKWVRLACERHLDDLEDGEGRGIYFDAEAATRAIKFFSFLTHSKGEWAGRVVTLELWQAFVVAMVFGWKKTDGLRRFKTAYMEVARKNGKTTLAAGIGLYLMLADGEAGAEVYTAATKRDQARIAHDEATRMVKASPYLRKRVRVVKDNILIPDTASKFVPLGRDADSLDGLNVHGAIIDELHAHPSRDMVDILDTATGARRQPLLFEITTAGHNRQSVCFENHEYTAKLLTGSLDDDAFFGIIYTLDEGDDWEDSKLWIKANPNLQVSKRADNMQEKAAKAKAMPSALNAFLRLELNIWTQSETKWLDFGKWQTCGQAVSAEGLRGRTCYGGLDLSSNVDISSLVLVFPPQKDGDKWAVLCRFWVPDEAMRVRSKRDRVPYETWVREGFITATPGEVVDYDFILDQIDADAEGFDLKEVAFDRWGASKLANDIQKTGNVDLVQFGQGFASMSPPMKELERMIAAGELAHGNNPVLSWMADNLVASEDAAGNIKPDKAKSTEKIDGMVALVMALDRATRNYSARKRVSIYETRGLTIL